MNNADIKLAVDTLAERRPTYTNADDYYRGGEAEVFANSKWKKILRSNGLDYVLNYCKTVVDTTLDRLEISSVVGTNEGANTKINELWEQNELELDANEVHKRALVYGECYVISWPDEEGNIQFSYNSPLTTVMIYDPDNPRKKLYAAKLWQSSNALGKPVVKMNIFYADRVEKYWREGELNLVTSGEKAWNLSEVVENPFGFVPVVHFRTNRPYGTPEHSAAIGPQDAINKIVMNHMETLDYQGAPQRFALSAGNNTSEFTDFDDDDTARENMGALKADPGSLWYLNGVTAVGQFQVAEHNNFTEPLMVYVKSMASLTQTPLHYFQNNGQFASGEALRTAEAPLTKKVKDRQPAFGSAWRELFRMALKMEGIETDIQIKWHSVESMDTSDMWAVAQVKAAMGIPLKIVLMEMGYDDEVAEEIAKQVDEEKKRQQEAGLTTGGGAGFNPSNGMNAHNAALKAQADQRKAQQAGSQQEN